jgi:hypothetical protein
VFSKPQKTSSRAARNSVSAFNPAVAHVTNIEIPRRFL